METGCKTQANKRLSSIKKEQVFYCLNVEVFWAAIHISVFFGSLA